MSYQRMKNLCTNNLSANTSNTKFLDPTVIIAPKNSTTEPMPVETPNISTATQNTFIVTDSSFTQNNSKNNSNNKPKENYCKTCG